MTRFTLRIFGVPLFSIDTDEYTVEDEVVEEEVVVVGDVDSHFGLVVFG